jgi:dCTP deaminase
MNTFWFINEFGTVKQSTDPTPPAGFAPVEYSTKPEQLKRQSPATVHPSAILSGDDIRRLCQGYKPMMSPYLESYRWRHPDYPGSEGISGGRDYNGYCIHLSNKWSVINPLIGMIDIANLDRIKSDFTLTTIADSYILAPHSCVLGVSVERFDMPLNVIARTAHKSTYARLGLDDIVTPIEAGWKGFLTIEVRNNGSIPIMLRAGMPITQLVFEWVQAGAGYDGIYQHQQQVPTPALGMNNNR